MVSGKRPDVDGESYGEDRRWNDEEEMAFEMGGVQDELEKKERDGFEQRRTSRLVIFDECDRTSKLDRAVIGEEKVLADESAEASSWSIHPCHTMHIRQPASIRYIGSATT